MSYIQRNFFLIRQKNTKIIHKLAFKIDFFFGIQNKIHKNS